LTQRTSRKSRITCAKASSTPTAKHAEDQPVQARIGLEGRRNLAIEYRRDEAADRQEDQHGEQEDLRAGQVARIVVRLVGQAIGAERFQQCHEAASNWLRLRGRSRL
jgi:hypothetical protein